MINENKELQLLIRKQKYKAMLSLIQKLDKVTYFEIVISKMFMHVSKK